MAETSVRSNMLPAGGISATMEAGQGQAFLPDTFTMQRLSEIFMVNSEQNCIKMNSQTLTAGQQSNFIINNVGLGESLELLVTGTITLVNSKSGTEVITLAPEFPFNIIQNIMTQFNGQTVLNSLSGYELLGIMAKRGKGVIKGMASSAGVVYTQSLGRVEKTIAWVKAGDNVTFATGNTLTGVTTATVATGAAGAVTGTIDFGFYVELPFTVRRNILCGLLPMQNNSVYANIAVTVPTINGISELFPLHVDTTWPTTCTVSSAITCQPTYNFWAIPSPNDSKLYQYLVANSYMLLSQGNNAMPTTGQEALQHSMPNNYYLMSLLLTMRDSAGALIDTYTYIDNPYLSYNGTARVDRRDMRTKIARDGLYNEGYASPLGQLIWDATNLDYLSNGFNTSKWLNLYQANNPMFIADVNAAVSVAGTYSVLREQLVPAAVKVV